MDANAAFDKNEELGMRNEGGGVQNLEAPRNIKGLVARP